MEKSKIKKYKILCLKLLNEFMPKDNILIREVEDNYDLIIKKELSNSKIIDNSISIISSNSKKLNNSLRKSGSNTKILFNNKPLQRSRSANKFK